MQTINLQGALTSRFALVKLAGASFGVLLLTASPLQAENKPKIYQPDSQPFYQSYGEWAAKWYQWAFSMPASQNPLTDTADVSAGQSGPVWFLGGSFTANSTVVRHGTVPAGTALFILVLNVECTTLEEAPFHGDTEAQLCDCAQSHLDPVENLFLIVDGVSVQNLESFRSKSTLWAWSLLEDDIISLPQPAGTIGNGVGDGIHVMLKPLHPGEHTIRFGGTFPQFDFSLDITYHLTVTPK